MKTTRLMATSILALATGLSPVLAQVSAIGAPEGQVNIVAWPGYIERGETMKEFDWVTSFEEATGCKVNVKTANTSDEMVALMNEGAVQIASALAIIGLVLLQQGKGADMGASFGAGASGTLFGATGSANALSRTTAIVATIFFICTLALANFATNRPTGAGSDGLLEGAPAASAPAASMPVTGAAAIPGAAPVAATAETPASAASQP